MPMYSLIEYSKNYRKTAGSLWNSYTDEPNNPPLNPPVGNNPPTVNYNADHITNSESFKYKISITGKTSNANQEDGKDTEQGNTNTKRNLEIVAPLKYLSNLWRSLDMPLINCEVSLTLIFSKNCVLTDTTTHTARPAINAPTNVTFKITDTKLYVSVVTLSTKDNNNSLKQLKSGFKETIKRNKYRSEMTNQTKTNNVNYLIDPIFTKVNRLFFL